MPFAGAGRAIGGPALRSRPVSATGSGRGARSAIRSRSRVRGAARPGPFRFALLEVEGVFEHAFTETQQGATSSPRAPAPPDTAVALHASSSSCRAFRTRSRAFIDFSTMGWTSVKRGPSSAGRRQAPSARRTSSIRRAISHATTSSSARRATRGSRPAPDAARNGPRAASRVPASASTSVSWPKCAQPPPGSFRNRSDRNFMGRSCLKWVDGGLRPHTRPYIDTARCRGPAGPRLRR